MFATSTVPVHRVIFAKSMPIARQFYSRVHKSYFPVCVLALRSLVSRYVQLGGDFLVGISLRLSCEYRLHGLSWSTYNSNTTRSCVKHKLSLPLSLGPRDPILVPSSISWDSHWSYREERQTEIIIQNEQADRIMLRNSVSDHFPRTNWSSVVLTTQWYCLTLHA